MKILIFFYFISEIEDIESEQSEYQIEQIEQSDSTIIGKIDIKYSILYYFLDLYINNSKLIL